MLRKTTEQLAERTEAMKKELATQKQEFSQRLFEVQQENDQVRCCPHQGQDNDHWPCYRNGSGLVRL